jgi:hypothetical protein
MATPAESLKLMALALSIALKFISRLNTIVCQINILARVGQLILGSAKLKFGFLFLKTYSKILANFILFGIIISAFLYIFKKIIN